MAGAARSTDHERQPTAEQEEDAAFLGDDDVNASTVVHAIWVPKSLQVKMVSTAMLVLPPNAGHPCNRLQSITYFFLFFLCQLSSALPVKSKRFGKLWLTSTCATCWSAMHSTSADSLRMWWMSVERKKMHVQQWLRGSKWVTGERKETPYFVFDRLNNVSGKTRWR